MSVTNSVEITSGRVLESRTPVFISLHKRDVSIHYVRNTHVTSYSSVTGVTISRELGR